MSSNHGDPCERNGAERTTAEGWGGSGWESSIGYPTSNPQLDSSNSSTQDFLLYALLGFGVTCVVIAGLVCAWCMFRRRRTVHGPASDEDYLESGLPAPRRPPLRIPVLVVHPGGGAEVAFKEAEKVDSEEEEESHDRIKAVGHIPSRSPNRAIRLQAWSGARDMGASGQLTTTRPASDQQH